MIPWPVAIGLLVGWFLVGVGIGMELQTRRWHAQARKLPPSSTGTFGNFSEVRIYDEPQTASTVTSTLDEVYEETIRKARQARHLRAVEDDSAAD